STAAVVVQGPVVWFGSTAAVALQGTVLYLAPRLQVAVQDQFLYLALPMRRFDGFPQQESILIGELLFGSPFTVGHAEH
ncbi:15589_t:CDS:2, partial [Dentiscutata heterogama]